MLRVKLCDLNHKIVAEWQRQFGKIENVEVFGGDIMAYKADAIVSPANSFGFMDGGIDGVYTKHFGPKVQASLQSLIRLRPMGELLVGEAIVVPTGNDGIPFMISAPTMRVPLDVSDTANPYLSFKAALIAARNKGFKDILCPGMGSATGNVSAIDCAVQMRKAYDFVFGKFVRFPNSIRDAYLEHIEVVGVSNVKGRQHRRN